MNGADIFVESLLKEGVDTIFGHPGGAILPLNDALCSGRIRHILTRHEQGAIHMAEGYARATGRPGVVLVTSGPGGTNVVTGLTDAFMDSTPVVSTLRVSVSPRRKIRQSHVLRSSPRVMTKSWNRSINNCIGSSM